MNTEEDRSQISDGYHTFEELYNHRHALFLLVMRLNSSAAWYSKFHEDGSKMDGWFIAGVSLSYGDISYHMPEKLWDNAKETGARERALGKKWDGHTSNDVIDRLMKEAGA